MNTIISELNYFTHEIGSDIAVPHFHSGYEIIYVVHGTVEIEINKVVYKVSAPGIILLNPFEWHKILAAENNYIRYMLVLDSAALEREVHPYLISMLKCRPAGFEHTIEPDIATADYIQNIFSVLEKERERGLPYCDRLISNEIYNLLIIIFRSRRVPSDLFNNQMIPVQRYIDENFKNIESIHSLARHFYMADGYLSRAFKKYSGYTPMEYLINTRLYNAQLMLINGTDNVEKICFDAGFRNVNNFIRQFKHRYGMSPLAFRKLNQNL